MSVRRLLTALGVIALVAAPLPWAVAASAVSTVPAVDVTPPPGAVAAVPFTPPSDKRLTVDDIRLVAGPRGNQVAIVSRGLSPLALVAVGIEGDARVSIVSGGTDFTAPTIWQRRGFGDICWKLVGFDDATTYTLPAAVVPFAAPRATWRYSAVIVSTQRGPVVYRYPAPAQFVSGNGLPIQSAVVCVKAVPTPRDTRIDLPSASASPSASATPTPSPSGASATASPSVSPTTSPSASGTASSTATAGPAPLPSPRPTSTPSPTPTPVNDSSNGNGGGDNDKKVTICHATSSQSNPYSLITVSTSAALNGHGGHTGPLYPQVGWGDVIPPFDDYPGMNWPAGAGLVADGCVVAPAPTPTPTPTDPGTVSPTPVTPERPVVPRPPIISVLPPYRPAPPIATLSPSPSGTASPPVATISPRPTVRPSRPVATIYPSPSGTASPPLATISPRPSASPSPPIATVSPTPSGTAGTPVATPTPTSTSGTPIATSTPSTGGSGGGATPTDASPAVPDGGSVTPEASDAGTSSIEPSVPACDSVTDGKVRLFLTNGVSAIEVTRAYDKLVCVAGARVGPGTDDVDQVVDDSTDSDPSLASTGSSTRTLLTASLILVGLGLLFVPGLARRR